MKENLELRKQLTLATDEIELWKAKCLSLVAISESTTTRPVATIAEVDTETHGDHSDIISAVNESDPSTTTTTKAMTPTTTTINTKEEVI